MSAVRRRTFLGGLSALLGSSVEGCRFSGIGDSPLLRVGIASDTHLSASGGESEVRACFRGFAEHAVDVVVIPGDVADNGLVSEYELFHVLWMEAFGALPGRNGAPELVVAWGNHDYRASSRLREHTGGADARASLMIADKDRVWRLLMGCGFPGEIYMRKIRGVPFVACHWGHENEIDGWLRAHADEVNASRLFFHVQHPHPSGTVFMGMRTECETVTKVLSDYPNCFSVSGHSHTNLADDTALWQGEFTVMGAGTVRDAAPRHGPGVPNYGNGYFKAKTAKPPYPHMGTCPTMSGCQGSILSLYGDEIRIGRFDFSTGEAIGDDWLLPLPLRTNAASPFVFPASAKGPEFLPAAEIRMEIRNGVNAMGDSERQARFAVTQARPVSRWGRAIANEFEVIAVPSGKTLAKSVTLQEGQGLPIADGFAYDAECVFGADEIPEGRFEVRVTPMNAAGVRGRTIRKEWP